MKRVFLLLLVLAFFPIGVFSQNQQASSVGTLRDYVGLIDAMYHPDVIAYFKKTKTDVLGKSGSGFVFNDAKGDLYILTNYHVISGTYALSITFERQDGFRRGFENLKVIAADKEKDLALLAFAPGDKPVNQGLQFLTRAIQEGEVVYSAGFPGLLGISSWQLGQGIVSNANVRNHPWPWMGNLIQHTAQIDKGNSGGPLLVPQPNVPSGYVVAGVNTLTLSAAGRQDTNFAIPSATAQAFFNNALNPKPETYRPAFDRQLAAFVKGLETNRAVYSHIAEYLSSACIGDNTEYAMWEMDNQKNDPVWKAFREKLRSDSVMAAMGYAVAWTIENSIKGKGAIKAEIKEVAGSGEDYTVIFTIGGKDHSSQWVREYGSWKIRSFGTVAAGDKTLISQKEEEMRTEAAIKERAEKLRLNSYLHVEVGYATLFDKTPGAAYISAEFFKCMGFKFYMGGDDFSSFGGFFGYRWDIPVQNVSFMPYARIGIETQWDKEWDDFIKKGGAYGLPFAITGQVGLKVTTSYVPRLFLGTAFQFNFVNKYESAGSLDKFGKPRRTTLAFTVGYAF